MFTQRRLETIPQSPTPCRSVEDPVSLRNAVWVRPWGAVMVPQWRHYYMTLQYHEPPDIIGFR
jgi:hypothetical protein